MREQIQKLLSEAAVRVVREIDSAALKGLDTVPVVPGKVPEHGDFASSLALALARPLGLPPRELAHKIVERLEDPDGLIDRVEVIEPGFINFFLTQGRWHELLLEILRTGERYGRSSTPDPERVLVEFVSANPTGPLTIGHGRNAVLGDAIARLLEAMGHEVPVLISRSSGVSEVLTHALKVDFWDVDDMADKIIAVLRHLPLSQTLRTHGAMEVRRLTWDGAAERCERIYHEVMNEMTHHAVP